MINSVSSNVFPFGFFVWFLAANNGTHKVADPQPPQNGCVVEDVTCVVMCSQGKNQHCE